MVAGREESVSTSNTRVSSSSAMLSARFTDKKVLPSPGKELVTMMRLARSTGAADLPWTLVSKGRLMTRNSSASCERGLIRHQIAERAQARKIDRRSSPETR